MAPIPILCTEAGRSTGEPSRTPSPWESAGIERSAPRSLIVNRPGFRSPSSTTDDAVHCPPGLCRPSVVQMSGPQDPQAGP